MKIFLLRLVATAYSLAKAADIVEWFGDDIKAEYYRGQSQKYASTVRDLCYDPQLGIYADDPEKTFYDQRASILAILCGAHSALESQVMMRKIWTITPNSTQELIYFTISIYTKLCQKLEWVILPNPFNHGKISWIWA